MHIAIAGNIGCGKTTLTKLLVKRYGWLPKFEPVEHNPYLEDFYKDMDRWSFNLQVYFLNKRFRDIVEIARSKDTIVQDRTIFEDACIFAPNLHNKGLMSDRDFANYSELFPSDEEAADKWFKCKLVFIMLDEKSGAEKKSSTQVLVQAADLRDAVKKLDEGMKGTMADYEIALVSETPIMDVYPFHAEEQEK